SLKPGAKHGRSGYHHSLQQGGSEHPCNHPQELPDGFGRSTKFLTEMQHCIRFYSRK
ncbi:hypothetical protein CSKR_202925, partial [Clonorchis sinensis]